MSELGKLVDEAQKSGTTSHNDAINGWKKKIRTGVWIIVGLFFLWWAWVHILPLLTSRGSETPQEPGEMNFSTLLLLLLLSIAVTFLPFKFSWVGWIPAMVIFLVMLSSFSPTINSLWEDTTKGVNHGDWSASSDYEPRTVYGGTVTFTRIGQVEEFYAKGEVLLKNEIFSQRSCLAISPISKFFLYSLEGNRKNFLTPISGEKEWVMVEARRAGTCPNPLT